MKKLIISFCMITMIVFAFPKKAMAEYGNGLSVGAAFTGGYSAWSILGITATVQAPKVPLMFGLQLSTLGWTGFAFHVTADWWAWKPILTTINGKVPMHFYVGPGLYTGLALHKNEAAFNLGIRVPLGFSFLITKNWEVYIELAPGLNLIDTYGNYIYFAGAGRLGFRYWF